MPVPLPSPAHSSPMQSTSTSASPSTMALLSLSQDITALISLSLEATASLVYDWVNSTLSSVGLCSSSALTVAPIRSRRRGEGGRGMAVVVVGASEATGQSLTLHLAKSGYTVFPLLPLPSPDSPPTSTALSTLLLTWSGIQKRLRTRNPNHTGAVVPVITDPEVDSDGYAIHSSSPKGKGRFRHAGQTIRAYCRENDLVLISIVCAARSLRTPSDDRQSDGEGNGRRGGMETPVSADRTPRAIVDISPTPLTEDVALPLEIVMPPRLIGLVSTDENRLLGLYRANILDPLAVIRELSDLLSGAEMYGRGRGRIVFVNSPAPDEGPQADGALRIVSGARGEAARLLHEELGRIAVDVCEVVVGPMAPRLSGPSYHLRHDSDDSATEKTKLLLKGTSNADEEEAPPRSRNDILASRIAFLSRIWAVDDALLFSAVRRAIEDQYPRYRHHAGLSPLLDSLADATPGGGLVRAVGRWVVRRLLMPRSGAASRSG